jgi:hypothetical protein
LLHIFFKGKVNEILSNSKKPEMKHKNLDLTLLLFFLCCSLVYVGGVAAQTGNQAEGEDVDIYVDYGGLAFQDGNNPSSFIALYTTTGALNTSDNDFFVGPSGGGKFEFVSNETFNLQFLLSVSATIEGDSSNDVRSIEHNSNGLSAEYTVNAGDHVIIYWIQSVGYSLALPLISFWGMVGGGLFGSIFTGLTIRKKRFAFLWAALICFMAAFVFYLIFVNL